MMHTVGELPGLKDRVRSHADLVWTCFKASIFVMTMFLLAICFVAIADDAFGALFIISELWVCTFFAFAFSVYNYAMHRALERIIGPVAQVQ